MTKISLLDDMRHIHIRYDRAEKNLFQFESDQIIGWSDVMTKHKLKKDVRAVSEAVELEVSSYEECLLAKVIAKLALDAQCKSFVDDLADQKPTNKPRHSDK